jgi:hypothetical protein
MVVLGLLSNAASMGTFGDGLPTPAVRVDDGSYYVTRTLTKPSSTTRINGLCQKVSAMKR